MPTIKVAEGPYRFFFYSFDCNEPEHVHIQRERRLCKFWLRPITLSKNNGFAPKELNALRRLVAANRTLLLEAWHEHCD